MISAISFFKLGEEALIPVSDFTVAGKKRRGFRATLNKLESLGYQFEILDTPLDEATYERLHDISRNWLGETARILFQSVVLHLLMSMRHPLLC